jgi:threonine/homoserine/homoserine lactone efflux protein
MVQVVSEHELWRSLVQLALAAAALMGSPGPSTVSLTATGAAFALHRSLLYCTGLIAGTLAVLLAVVAGVTALLLALPAAAPALAAASAAYILYLAYRIAIAPPLSAQGVGAKAPSFSGGLLLGSANPKAYVAITAVYSGSALPVGSIATEALAKTAVLGLMIVLIHLIWLMAGASLSRLLRDPIGSRIANLLLAATLVITAILAFTS